MGQIRALPGGGVVFLDLAPLSMRLYDSTGDLRVLVGRAGSGPGEFASPRGMAVASDGRIVVNDPGNSRLTLFSPVGHVLREIDAIRPGPAGFSMAWDGSFDREGRLLASVGIRARHNPRGDSTLVTERWAADFSRSDSTAMCGAPLSVLSSPAYYSYSRILPNSEGQPSRALLFPEIPFTAQGPTHVRDHDALEWSPREYGSGELLRRAGGRCDEIVARIILRGPRVPVPATLRDEALLEVPKEHHARIPTEYPWFRALRIDGENQLWVERDSPDGRRFEVFSSDGRLLAQVDAPRELILEGRSEVAIGKGVLYGLARDSNDVQSLVAWRVTR